MAAKNKFNVGDTVRDYVFGSKPGVVKSFEVMGEKVIYALTSPTGRTNHYNEDVLELVAIAAPTEAPQAAPVASADSEQVASVEATTSESEFKALVNRAVDELLDADEKYIREHGYKKWEREVAGLEGSMFDEDDYDEDDDYSDPFAAQPTSAQAGGDAVSDDDEPEGYARPCDVCDGSGTIAHKDYGYLPCSSCDGTGIYTPEGELVRASVNAMAEKDATIARLEAELATARAALVAIATHDGLYSRNDDFAAGYNRGMTVLSMLAKNALGSEYEID